eukprot:CAMPEP_0170585480 /NCGR_PEP_ID=MMETSP0224-20130122/9236_1 /TAXON_ID=285029 /ORGANISM="Togula jolla, Strain CCCM 725" /LENGTH=42 /DNA_ID= /DNA_START= /DNA_END= /DNA_ORIENTATION=
MALLEAVAEGDPVLLYEQPEPIAGPVEGVQEHLGQGGDLSGA